MHGDLKGVRLCFSLLCLSQYLNLSPQDNILVDKSGRARLNDFGFTSIASLNCTETSASGFKGTQRWMAPELFNINDEDKSGLSTRASDVFALGMVTFEVRSVQQARLSHGFEPPCCTFPGVHGAIAVPRVQR